MEAAACTTSSGVRDVLTGIRPGLRERDAVALLGWDGSPLSCHLMLTRRAAGRVRAAQPGRPRRSSAATRSPWRSGSGARSTAGPGSSSRTPPGYRTAIGDYVERLVAPVLRGRRRVVRRAAHRADRRRAARDHRPPPRRPVLRDLPEPGPPDRPRRVGELADPAGLRRSSSGRAWRSRSTSSRRPARRTSRRTSRTGSPSPTRRCAATFATGYPEAWARIQAPPGVHGRRARHRAPPRRPAVLEHPGLPAAVPAPARPGHDDGRMTNDAIPATAILLDGDGATADRRCAAGARFASLVVGGHELLVTDGDGPIWWGCYPMVPFAGRIRDGGFAFRGATHQLAREPAAQRHPRDGVRTGLDRGVGRRGSRGPELTTDLGPGWPFAGRVTQSIVLGAGWLDARPDARGRRADAGLARLASLVPPRRSAGRAGSSPSTPFDVRPRPGRPADRRAAAAHGRARGTTPSPASTRRRG